MSESSLSRFLTSWFPPVVNDVAYRLMEIEKAYADGRISSAERDELARDALNEERLLRDISDAEMRHAVQRAITEIAQLFWKMVTK